jgi:hypothetical protein
LEIVTYELFVELRQLAADRRRARAERRGHVGERVGEAVGALVEDQGPRLGRQCGETAAALGGTRRQEAFEDETIGRQTRDRQERGDSGRARNGDDRHPGRDRGLEEPIPRIGDAGRPGVRDERDRTPREEIGDERRGALRLHGVVVAAERLRDPEMGEEAAASPRVLGGDQVDGPQGVDRARGQVAEVPDRRRDDIEGARHEGRSSRTDGARRQPPGRRETTQNIAEHGVFS